MARQEFELPEPLLSVLPSDPFEQLDVARKITSIALATRVSKLESEASMLRQSLAQKDDLTAQLQAHVENLDASLAELSTAHDKAQQEKTALLNENAALLNTVQKLRRDVSKLEAFKKTLMQSLTEEEENTQVRAPTASISDTNLSAGSNVEEDEAALQNVKATSAQSQLSETGSSISEEYGSAYSDTDAWKQSIQNSLRLSSLNTTPRFTPPGSPPRLTAALSSPKLSKPVSPRRHSIAISRNIFDQRSSAFSPMPSNHMTSPFDTGSQTGRTRVDGKEFFRQVRSRLSYEQFSSFLANVKELNTHKQTREETLHKAEEIFGPDNKDLYTIFEGLITRNVH